MLPLKGVKTFDEYSVTIFMAYILRKLEKVEQIDILWDRYLPMSLKKAIREKRGVGRGRQVLVSTPLPANWQDFLKVDENKEELTDFLARHVANADIPPGKILLTALHTDVLCTSPH